MTSRRIASESVRTAVALGSGHCCLASQGLSDDIFVTSFWLPPCNQAVEHRDQEGRDEGGGQHAADHARADRVSAGGTSACRDRERHHAQNEGQRRHHDRAEAQASGINRSLDCACAFLTPEHRKLHNQDRVLGRQTNERHQTNLEVDVVGQTRVARSPRGHQRERMEQP